MRDGVSFAAEHNTTFTNVMPHRYFRVMESAYRDSSR